MPTSADVLEMQGIGKGTFGFLRLAGGVVAGPLLAASGRGGSACSCGLPATRLTVDMPVDAAGSPEAARLGRLMWYPRVLMTLPAT